MTDKEVIKLAQGLITAFKCDSETMIDFLNTVIKKFDQHPKTIQEEQAESEKYEKVYDDGYNDGYVQARFDYELQPCEDCVSRAYIESIVEELENICINGDEHILSLLSNIKNAPPAIPQPFINKPCISEGVCREDKIQVLDKIRAEIENHCGFAKENHCEYCYSCPNLMGVKEILEVIDKYRTESEVNRNDNKK